MRTLLLAGAAIISAIGYASAANVVTFSQTSGSNTLVSSVNGAQTQTTLTISDAALSIGQLIAGAPPATAFLDMTATSNDVAVTFLGAIIQHYDGSFCLTSGPGCTGINILSGTFSDAAFGAAGGPGITVNVNNPPDTLTLTSSIIPAADLAAPNAMSLGFTNLSVPLAILGTTIDPFTASFAGTVSANVAPVGEPMGMAVLGMGILGLGMVRWRHR